MGLRGWTTTGGQEWLDTIVRYTDVYGKSEWCGRVSTTPGLGGFGLLKATVYSLPLCPRILYHYYCNTVEDTRWAYEHRHKPKDLRGRCERTIKRTYRHLRTLLRRAQAARVVPWTVDEYVESFDGSKRKLYENARDELYQRGWRSGIKSFVKIEPMGVSSYKAPRLIQARATTYNIMVGRFLKPLEHWVYSTFLRDLSYQCLFAKCMDPYVLAANIQRRFSLVHDPVVLCLDHSAFDSHVHVSWLRQEHRFYLEALGFDSSSELGRLLKRQISNTCRSISGFRYRSRGGRMSGDVNTGFGNCIINYLILRDMFPTAQLIINGDDSLVILPKKDFQLTTTTVDGKTFIPAFAKYNMKTELGLVTDDIREADFCQAKLGTDSGGRLVMIPNLSRLLGKFGMTYKVRNLRDPNSYVRDVAWAYTQLYPNLTHLRTLMNNIYQHYDKLSLDKLGKTLRFMEPQLWYLIEHNRIEQLPDYQSSEELVRWPCDLAIELRDLDYHDPGPATHTVHHCSRRVYAHAAFTAECCGRHAKHSYQRLRV